MTKAKLIFHDQELDLDIIEGSEGEKAVDINTLRAKTKLITIDSGFMNTGSCKSSITFIDGEKGILRYRGYPIEQVAGHKSFLETTMLLCGGEFPKKEDLNIFSNQVKSYYLLPYGIRTMIENFPKNSHPMAVLSAATVAMCAYYPELTQADISSDRKRQAISVMMGHYPAIAAYFYRISNGWAPISGDPTLGFAANFLYMMGFEFDQELAEVLDLLFVLHADHEQNCSCSTVRIIGSSKANLFSAISGGVNALWGPLHGGANQKVIEMLQEIQEHGGDYKHFLDRVKNKDTGAKLMGFGHRVYKNFDPRAKLVKKACDLVLKKMDVKDHLLDIAKGLEEEALNDQYFIDRKLYPNVDFYSGLIYRALGIPSDMFTVMFALGRLPGWISQWKEMVEEDGIKIARPRQIYTGPTKRDI